MRGKRRSLVAGALTAVIAIATIAAAAVPAYASAGGPTASGRHFGTGIGPSKAARWRIVSHTPGCRVSINPRTGHLSFSPMPGHYGHFIVVVRHGRHSRTYRFTVPRSTPAPPGEPTKPGTPSRPVIVTTSPVTTSPVTPRGPTPSNVTPSLSVSGRTIGWASDPGATDFKGAVCTDARGTADRRCVYYDPAGATPLQTNWTVPTGCGTLYYGVASEGAAGELWSNSEVSLTWPACQGPAPSLQSAPAISGTLKDGQTLTLTPGAWSNVTSEVDQWERCSSSGSCIPVVENPADPDHYALGDSDVYSTLKVVETVSGPGGQATTSVSTSEIIPPPPTDEFRDTYPPSLSIEGVSGTQAQPGQTIALHPGTWAWLSQPATDVWEICDSMGHCGPVAPQPSGDTFTPGAADAGMYVYVQETGVGLGGTTTVDTIPDISIGG